MLASSAPQDEVCGPQGRPGRGNKVIKDVLLGIHQKSRNSREFWESFGDLRILRKTFLKSYTGNSAERGDDEEPHVAVIQVFECLWKSSYSLL